MGVSDANAWFPKYLGQTDLATSTWARREYLPAWKVIPPTPEGDEAEERREFACRVY